MKLYEVANKFEEEKAEIQKALKQADVTVDEILTHMQDILEKCRSFEETWGKAMFREKIAGELNTEGGLAIIKNTEEMLQLPEFVIPEYKKEALRLARKTLPHGVRRLNAYSRGYSEGIKVPSGPPGQWAPWSIHCFRRSRSFVDTR